MGKTSCPPNKANGKDNHINSKRILREVQQESNLSVWLPGPHHHQWAPKAMNCGPYQSLGRCEGNRCFWHGMTITWLLSTKVPKRVTCTYNTIYTRFKNKYIYIQIYVLYITPRQDLPFFRLLTNANGCGPWCSCDKRQFKETVDWIRKQRCCSVTVSVKRKQFSREPRGEK